jgi:type IV secretory pathway VirB6-like protein
MIYQYINTIVFSFIPKSKLTFIAKIIVNSFQINEFFNDIIDYIVKIIKYLSQKKNAIENLR